VPSGSSAYFGASLSPYNTSPSGVVPRCRAPAGPLGATYAAYTVPQHVPVDVSPTHQTVSSSRPRCARAGCQAYSVQQPCQLSGFHGHLASHCHRTDIADNYKGRRQVALTAQGHSLSYLVDASWYLDRGATDHLTNQVDNLTAREPYHGHDKVYTANGAGMHISHIGQASLPTHTSKQLRLTNVLHV
jgi:hypothetical protein